MDCRPQLEYHDLTFQLPEVETLILDNGIRLFTSKLMMSCPWCK
jgi:hypothetical protein